MVVTLHSNSSISTALSEVLIWKVEAPYVEDNIDKLIFFGENRIAFNGDIAHLLDLPVTGDVAYINSLCQGFNHAFSELFLNYQKLSLYSFTMMIISHERGHSLGSPHTHTCFWNEDNTAIDACSPDNRSLEGCNDVEILSKAEP